MHIQSSVCFVAIPRSGTFLTSPTHPLFTCLESYLVCEVVPYMYFRLLLLATSRCIEFIVIPVISDDTLEGLIAWLSLEWLRAVCEK